MIFSGVDMNLPTESNSQGSDSESDHDFLPPTSLPTIAPQKKRQPLQTPEPGGDRLAFDIETGDDGRLTVSEKVQRKRGELSSFFISTFFHTTLFIVLALWISPPETADPTIGLVAEFSIPEDELQPAIETSPVQFNTEAVAESPVENTSDATHDAPEEMAAAEIPTLVDSIEEQPSVDTVPTTEAPAPRRAFAPGGGLQGRDAESRARLAARFGGSPGSEQAVENGLRWIINHQCSDGAWRFRHHKSDCDGRCGNQGKQDAATAATGLALMSLLGAGYTHEKGPYQGEILRGLEYLNNNIRYLRYGGSLVSGRKQLYGHAIATTALAEAMAMTGDERYRKAVTEAHRYIINTQNPKNGGWKYEAQKAGDMSVTGWIVMALKACDNAGVATEAKDLKLARGFVESLAWDNGVRFGYQIRGNGEIEHADQSRKPALTAVGHLMRMYLHSLGDKSSLQAGCKLIAAVEPSDSDVYFNYYGSLVLHHAKSAQWEQWNPAVRDMLIRTQATRGHEAGSWHFDDTHGAVGGRLYTTAMAVMTLEVYYRFMPLYEFDVGSDTEDSE